MHEVASSTYGVRGSVSLKVELQAFEILGVSVGN